MSGDYAALRQGALLFDRSDRMRMRLRGAKAAETVTGLVTNDVLSLTPGSGMYAAALTPKGKISADVRIFLDDDGILVDSSARAAHGWREMVKKYVNPRVTPYEDVTATTADLAVFGVAARRLIAAATGLDAERLAALPPYGHLPFSVNGSPAFVARVPELEVEGFEIFLSTDFRQALTQLLLAGGAVRGSQSVWDIARIEAGRPEWGVEMSDSTIPQEANFDELGAISYTKGCYIGQETVARVHFRGHVNRFLRKARFVCGSPPPAGAELFDDEGKQVGELRSVAVSPRLGGVAIAMVRREVPEGASLEARWAGESVGGSGGAGGSCTIQLHENEKGATS